MDQAEKNFWLWGNWSQRQIKQPFLTQKVPGKIRDVIIGKSFIIALKEDGTLMSWGEDKHGCLGLGPDKIHSPDPKTIGENSPVDLGKVVDIQYGKHHILALTNDGKVYAWGDNQCGQLGLGLTDKTPRSEPACVDELKHTTVVQILAVDNMSYALTSHGHVYAWGENKDGALGLDHDYENVSKPEPMMRMKETKVKKLVAKESDGGGGDNKSGKSNKIIIAFVELADPLPAKDQIGGFDKPLGEPDTNRDGGMTAQVLSGGVEKDIFEGVDLMRRVMDNTQDWWSHMLEVRHGSPYDDNPTHNDENANRQVAGDHCTAEQLDRHVGLDILERASYELDMLIQSAKAQLLEIRNKKGTKNVKFMLSLFMDDCKLRREKIRRTVAARQLVEHKRGINQVLKDADREDSKDSSKRMGALKAHLEKTAQRIRNLKTYDEFTKALQESLTETLECKMQVIEMQLEYLAHTELPALLVRPALNRVKEKWGELKRFSIYNLYQECTLRGQSVKFSSDDEMLAFLVQTSDAKIDQIIRADDDKAITRDPLVHAVVYDLLRENAELRKMCNTYQLKVLLMREGKERPGAASGAQGSSGTPKTGRSQRR